MTVTAWQGLGSRRGGKVSENTSALVDGLGPGLRPQPQAERHIGSGRADASAAACGGPADMAVDLSERAS